MRGGRGRRDAAVEEGESYYVSMTDMMVGVLFIFIILLCFFTVQFHSTTQALTSAKDAQTATLLKMAAHLETRETAVEVDPADRILCVPGAVLAAAGVTPDPDRHCFAFSASVQTAAEKAAASQGKARAQFLTFLGADLQAAGVSTPVSADFGGMTFPADQLFLTDSATLSPDGRATAQKVSVAMAARLPCYGYGVPATAACGGATKMSVVNVSGQAGIDASTEAGRAAAALSLQRAVAFQQALVQAQPLLGRIKNLPPGAAGAQPLLRVASYSQGQAGAPAAGAGQTIGIQFNIAQ